MTEEIFSARLRSEMERGHFSQAELARLLKISKSYVTEMLGGRKEPSSQMIQHMSFVFGCRAEWLQRGKGRRTGEHLSVNDRENRLVRDFRRLPKEMKDSISSLIRCYVEKSETDEEE